MPDKDNQDPDVIDTTGDENDDWMQKSNPTAYVEELKIHDELAAAYRKKREAG